MTQTIHAYQDGRTFYVVDPVSREVIDTWTAKDGRRGDTTENAIAWRDMFVAHHVNRGFMPVFDGTDILDAGEAA